MTFSGTQVPKQVCGEAVKARVLDMQVTEYRSKTGYLVAFFTPTPDVLRALHTSGMVDARERLTLSNQVQENEKSSGKGGQGR